jgi:hypothetical protein
VAYGCRGKCEGENSIYYRNPIKIMCTTRLNDGIFKLHRFSVVTPARLHKSDFVFPSYVYRGTFDNPPGYLLSVRGTVFGALCADGFFLDMLRLLV